MVQSEGRHRFTRTDVPDEPLIGRSAGQCLQCWGCVRHCPARALRALGGAIEVIPERCVRCGACVTECGSFGLSVRSDLDRVRELLASGRTCVALLASEYIAALHPRTPVEVERALEALGFAGVETTVLGEELVAAAYEQVQPAGGAPWPRLRSTCPVCVDWVRRFYPELTEALIPVVPPYVAQARLIRRIYEGDVAVVYVSPCWARKDEVFESEFRGDVDVAIGFDELRELIDEAAPVPAIATRQLRRPRAVKQLSATDGFPRRTLIESDRTDREVVSVRGLHDLDALLSAIVRGESCPSVVDMLNCEGCIDGPCVNREISVFAKRNIDLAERERQAPPAVDSRTFLSTIPAVDLKRSFRASPASTREPTDEEIDQVLLAGEFESRAEAIDCGVCGYDTCVEHAVAIWLGNSTWEICFPLEKKRLERERERYEKASVTDDLTGLHNRRALGQRLAEEVARSLRYGSALSLVMMDLDGFKDVNDRFGHSAGDVLLRSVGVLLRSEVRATDVAVRYGGDEFALILPNTGKTDAWAVAEKVNASLRQLAIELEDGTVIRTTASVGVASFGEEHNDADRLLEAADAALYRAKRGGRDRVEIAAG